MRLLALLAALGGTFYDSGRNGSTGLVGPNFDYDSQPATLGFDFNPGDSSHPPSILRLDQTATLTRGGVSVSPTWQYNANDADSSTWPAWHVGASLAIAGSGTVPTLGSDSPLLGDDDDSMLCKGGKTYQAAASTSGDVTTEDLLFRALFKMSANSAEVLFEKKGGGVGYTLKTNSGTARLTLTDGTDTANIDTATLTSQAWYFLQVYVDRSGSAQAYINGSASGSAVAVSSVDSLTNSGKLTFCGDSANANQYNSNIAYAALFARASWFATHLNGDASLTQFAKLTRTYAGAVGDGIPLLFSHPSGYMRKYNGSTATTYFLVGAGWPRVEKNATLNGYFSERPLANLFLQSQDVATTWTKLDNGDTFSLDAVTDPLGGTTADGFIPDSTNGDHGLTQTVTLPTTADFTWSGFFKAGTHHWISLYNSTLARRTYADITACTSCTADGFTNCPSAVGTASGGNSFTYARNFGGGWCRIETQNDGVGGSQAWQWQIADADSDHTTSGNGSSIAVYAWGLQSSNDTDVAGSPIVTTTAAGSRGGDYMLWNSDGSVTASEYSINCSVQVPYALDNPSVNEVVLSIADTAPQTTSTEFSALRIRDDSRATCATTDGGVAQALLSYGSAPSLPTDPEWMNDGTRQDITCTAKANNFGVHLAGVAGSTDTSGTMPTPTRIWIGGHELTTDSGGYWYNAITQRCRIFNLIGRVQ